MTHRHVVVQTTQGAVSGNQFDHHASFLAIPYAAPPRGASRFQAPRPHAPWSETWDATESGPTSPQGVRQLGALHMSPYFGPGWVHGPEYLTVNIWTPQTVQPSSPVMVFVHGGGFVAGSNRATLYDGSRFARDGVVLVTVNYRLGIPGFLDLPGAPPNRGLLDVLAALRWVQQNIGTFGGDRDNVTVFGQSAGATITGALLSDPATRGLVRRMIIQSGSGRGAFTPEQARRVTSATATHLGIEPHARAFSSVSDEDLVAVMPNLAGIDLATERDRDPLIGLSPFSLVLDHQPADAVAAGHGVDVDLLIGTNTEEGHLYLAPFGNLVTSTRVDVEAAAALVDPDARRYLEALRRRRPEVTFGELRSEIMSEALFVAGSRSLANAHAGHPKARTFRYEFAWRSAALEGQLGAAHTVELPFVFDVTDHADLRGPNALLGSVDPPPGLASRVHAAWVAFATSGDPGWQPYDHIDGATMRIAEEWTLSTGLQRSPHSTVRSPRAAG